MAAPTSLPALLDSLTQSLSSALEIGPKVAAIEPLAEGISLLDVKNDLLLSYLQHLVFLILVKIRNAKSSVSPNGQDVDDTAPAVQKLIELRLYLEKGVRPLEEKLRYQIDRVLRVADDAERRQKMSETPKASNGAGGLSDSVGEDAESDLEGGSSESELGDADRRNHEEGPDVPTQDLRPRLAAFTIQGKPSVSTPLNEAPDVWRPSKTRRILMPEDDRRQKAERRPHRSGTMEEYLATEYSLAPIAEPSIGTTISSRGRKMKTAAELKEEAERQDYEERHLTRLPKESKKDRAKKAKAESRNGRTAFGGEEWRELGEGADRIDRLTKRKNAATGTRALLDKSRKRSFNTVDGPKQSGSRNAEIGERFQKRLKLLESGRRDRGKRSRRD